MPRKPTGTTSKTSAKRTTKKTTAKKAKRAPSKAAASPETPAPASAAGTLRVRQVRSGIGHAETYRRTLRALGLKHHQDTVVVRDTASVRGMLHKVRHLVHVTREEA